MSPFRNTDPTSGDARHAGGGGIPSLAAAWWQFPTEAPVMATKPTAPDWLLPPVDLAFS